MSWLNKFEEFIDPGHPLSATTIQLTGITDEMVRGSKSVEQVLKEFHEFSKDCILVAHNASFDMGFLNTGYENGEFQNKSTSYRYSGIVSYASPTTEVSSFKYFSETL